MLQEGPTPAHPFLTNHKNGWDVYSLFTLQICFHETVSDQSRMVLTLVYNVQSKLISCVPFLMNNYMYIRSKNAFCTDTLTKMA